ncbi:hypothetical protein HDU76_003696, partial [Blyttiomyces sp. JEL0837]
EYRPTNARIKKQKHLQRMDTLSRISSVLAKEKARASESGSSYSDFSSSSPNPFDMGYLSSAGRMKMDGEVRNADFPAFEAALDANDRVAAWLKYKDICMSEETQKSLQTSHVSRLLKLLVQHKPPKIDFMNQVVTYSDQLGIPLDLVCFNTMIEAYSRAGDGDGAKQQLAELAKRGLVPDIDTYNQFLDLYTRDSQLDAAVAFFKKMEEEGIKPDVTSFNALVQGSIKCERYEQAMNYLSEMERRGISPNERTMDLQIHLYAAKGELDKAEKIYSEVEKHGIESNLVMATSLMRAFAHAGNADKVVDIFKNAVTERKVVPDVIMYTTLVFAQIRAKRLEAALLCFEQMVDAGCRPDSVAFHNIVSGFCDAGDPRRGEEVVIAMQSGGLAPGLGIRKTLLSAYLDIGSIPDAVRIFEQVRASGISPSRDMYNRLLKGLAADFDTELLARYWGRWKALAKAQKEELEDIDEDNGKGRRGRKPGSAMAVSMPDAESHRIVVEAYLACPYVDKARVALTEMVEANVEPTPELFISMVETLVRQRRLTQAAEVMVLMRECLKNMAGGEDSPLAAAAGSVMHPIVKEHSSQFESLVMKLLQESNEVESGENGSTRQAFKAGGSGDLAMSSSSFADLAQDEYHRQREAEDKRILGLELYREMIAADCRPSEETFRAVLLAHGRGGDLVSAVKTWTSFRAVHAKIAPHPTTTGALLACVRDVGGMGSARAVIDMVKADKLLLDEQGHAAVLCMMARFGWGDEFFREVVDMVNDGIPLNPRVVKAVELQLQKAHNHALQRAIMRFFEENWPEALTSVDESDDVEGNHI